MRAFLIALALLLPGVAAGQVTGPGPNAPVVATGGTVPRTAAARAADVVNLHDFAICDGNSHALSGSFATLGAAQAAYPAATSLTNQIDGVGLAKAVALAITRGAEIVVPNNTCLSDIAISGTIAQGLGIKVRGSGKNSKILFSSGVDGFNFQLAPNGSTASYALRSSIEITDLTIQTANTAPGNTGISISSSAPGTGFYTPVLGDRVSIRNVVMEASNGGAPNGNNGAWAHDIVVLGVRNVDITGFTFIGGGSDTTSVGVYLDQSSGGDSVNHNISGMRALYGGIGIALGSTSTTTPLQGIVIDKYMSVGTQNDIVAQVSGSATQGTSDGLFITNGNFGSISTTIIATGFNTVMLSNSYFVGPASPYISLVGGRRLVIGNNTFLGQGSHIAISVADVTSGSDDMGNQISGNLFANYGVPPISLSGSTCGTLVQGNAVASAGLNVVSDTSSCSNTFVPGTSNNVVGINYDTGVQTSRAPMRIKPGANGITLGGGATGTPGTVTAIGDDTNVLLQLLGQGSSGAVIGQFFLGRAPTTADIPNGTCGAWGNFGDGTLKIYCNFGGAFRSVTLN